MHIKAVTTDYQQRIRESILYDETFLKATFSGPGREQAHAWIRVLVRPVLLRGQKHVQFSYFDAKKDITKNYRDEEAARQLEQLLAMGFKNIHVQTGQMNIAVTITPKGKALVHTTQATDQARTVDLSHDHQKAMPLTAAEAAPFLQAVGIMAQDGKIKADMQHKFRQINEFLKLVQQTGELDKFATAPLHVVDCGCGSAYLTFAFFYYLNHVLKIPTHLTGIDINAELLSKHAEKSAQLDWPDLTFQANSIIDFQPTAPPAIVLALHACDTATDEALAQGIGWQSKLIICAPCCQHHLQKQLDHQSAPSPFAPVARHNILKERLGDILTDALRALILRIMGYQTDVVQFVSSEHTAKNIMIRAVKSLPVGDAKYVREYNDLKAFWQVTPYLEQALGEQFTRLL